MKSILLFGTFDGIHEGHRALFDQAKRAAEHVVVAVAPDQVVTELKGRPPKHDASVRIAALQDESQVDEVVLGDLDLGQYQIVQAIQPSLIGIGYDQQALGEDIRSWLHQHMPDVTVIRFDAFQPEQYKSSLLNSV